MTTHWQRVGKTLAMRGQRGNVGSVAMQGQLVGNALAMRGQRVGNMLAMHRQHVGNALATCWQCVGNVITKNVFHFPLTMDRLHVDNALATCWQRISNIVNTKKSFSFSFDNGWATRLKRVGNTLAMR